MHAWNVPTDERSASYDYFLPCSNVPRRLRHLPKDPRDSATVRTCCVTMPTKLLQSRLRGHVMEGQTLLEEFRRDDHVHALNAVHLGASLKCPSRSISQRKFVRISQRTFVQPNGSNGTKTRIRNSIDQEANLKSADV